MYMYVFCMNTILHVHFHENDQNYLEYNYSFIKAILLNIYAIVESQTIDLLLSNS